MNKKNLSEVAVRIRQLRLHPNFLKEDQQYMDEVVHTYFKYNPTEDVTFKFGYIEGYFKALESYVSKEDADKKIRPSIEIV